MYLEKVQAEERLREYEKEMELQELSVRTIHKYLTDIRQWLEKVEETVITKEMIVSYKKELKKKYKAASVNSKIISINRYLRWLGFSDVVVRTERIQAPNICNVKICKGYRKNKAVSYYENDSWNGITSWRIKVCDGRCYHRWVYPNLEQGKI